MLVAILGLLDIIAGITIFYSVNFLALYLTYVILFKGLVSIVSVMKNRKYLDWMGLIDLVAGIALALISMNVQSVVFALAGWMILLKGFYSFIKDAFKV
jgi:uncharacterized membrane protein HdeD (DUF308 family)